MNKVGPTAVTSSDSRSARASLGILMLDTRFPRIVGDVGNSETWPFPVRYRVVKGIGFRDAIGTRVEGCLAPFITAGRELVDAGVSGITTGCGFLSLLQKELASALPVPVATSSLMQAASIRQMLQGDQCVGIITIAADQLTEDHLNCANVPDGSPVVGVNPDGELASTILGDRPALDPEMARCDMIEAAEKLVGENTNVGAILLECTNMAPYAASVRAVTGLSVFSIYSFLTWFHAGLEPKTFDA